MSEIATDRSDVGDYFSLHAPLTMSYMVLVAAKMMREDKEALHMIWAFNQAATRRN